MDNNTLPNSDDMLGSGPNNQDLLDAVLNNNSDFSELLGEPLPTTDDDPDMVSEEYSNIDDPEDDLDEFEDEAVNEEDIEEDYEDDLDEDAEDDDATQDAEAFDLDDLDMGALVNVKIDGEVTPVSFEELVKGYQTSAHLSNQGRELGEQRKQFEEERSAAMAEIETMGKMSVAIVQGAENAKAAEYNAKKKELEQLKADGADRYELTEIREDMNDLAEEYKSLKQRREQMTEQFQEQQAKEAEAKWQEQMDYFHSNIGNVVPEWSEDHAIAIRDFALAEGIPEDMLAGITSPIVIKVLSDFMKLKTGISKGAAKRKAPAKAKGLPTRRTKTTSTSKAKANLRKRAFSESATAEDQMNFMSDFVEDLFSKK